MNIFVNVIFVGIVIILVIGGIYSIKLRKLLKEIKSFNKEHYRKIGYNVVIKEKEYFLNFFLLEPKTYKQIEPDETTSLNFDLKVGSIPVVRIALIDRTNIDYPIEVFKDIKVRDLYKRLNKEDLNIFDLAQKLECPLWLQNKLADEIESIKREKEILKEFC